jgi:hypothetical protein
VDKLEIRNKIINEIKDPKVDGVGVIAQPNYPPQLMIIRERLLKRILTIHEHTLNAYLRAMEGFVYDLSIEKPPIDVMRCWSKNMNEQLGQVNAQIDFDKIFEQPATALPMAKCEAIGVVRDKDGRIK